MMAANLDEQVAEVWVLRMVVLKVSETDDK
jgi:hypothetical protein